MHPFPHRYRARAAGGTSGDIQVTGDDLEPIDTQAPPQFGGPDTFWSPETLLVAAVADCYILTFRAVARASRLAWDSLTVDVEGVLDRVDGVTRFTRFTLSPRLCVDGDASESLAQAVLDKAKRQCLVSNSLLAEFELEHQILVNC